jgi:hypothetical protein
MKIKQLVCLISQEDTCMGPYNKDLKHMKDTELPNYQYKYQFCELVGFKSDYSD